MIQKLLLIITLALNSSSLPPQELIKNITTIYNHPFYKKISSLKAFETPISQPKIKEDLEKIVPSYLQTKELFSKSTLTQLKKENISLFGLSTFLTISFNYANYLYSTTQEKIALKLIEQNLINLQNLMKNAPTILEYTLALSIYSNLFSNYQPFSKALPLFKKYPPPNPSLYFKRLEAEREELFKTIDNLENIKSSPKNSSTTHKLFIKKVKETTKAELERYFYKMHLATSKEERLKFQDYLKREEEKLFSKSTQIKVAIHTFFANILSYFIGYNSQFDYLATYQGKILALIMLPHNLTTLYEEHQKMIQKYYNFLNQSH